jgi:hypothetical protein
VKRGSLFVGLIAGLLLAGCVSSRPITHYHRKPGVTPAQYAADEAACVEAAKRAYQGAAQQVPFQPGLVGAAVGGFARGYQGSAAGHAAAEECIIAKGYTKVAMTEEQRKAFESVPPEGRTHAAGLLAGGGSLPRPTQ